MKKRIILKWKDFNPDYEGWERRDMPNRRLQKERRVQKEKK